jgi:hypothetical protein
VADGSRVIGLYSVVAFTVTHRTREIGVRMALARGLRRAAAGIAIGLVLSAAATRFLGSFLYGMNPLDPAAFAGAARAGSGSLRLRATCRLAVPPAWILRSRCGTNS